MMLTLLNIIINAYMYSLHSLYIAINKVKTYSVVIFACSIVSILATITLTKYTNLGVFAIAGTSTLTLGLVNLLWVPMYAENLLEIHAFEFIKTIGKNYIALFGTCIGFLLLKNFLRFSNWISFLLSCLLSAILGYSFVFLFLLKKDEKVRIKAYICNKLRG